jgi:predicted glycosyltransferase
LRFLIDLLGPSHVHFFRHFIGACREAGHSVLITARPRGPTEALLDAAGLPYRLVGAREGKALDLVWELLRRSSGIADAAADFRPDVCLGVLGTSIAAAGAALGVPVHLFADREDAISSNWLTFPRAAEVIVPRSFKKVRGPRITVYPGVPELAYLHPDRFRPDPGVRAALGLRPGERFSIVGLRPSALGPGLFRRRFTADGRRRLVDALLRRGRAFVACHAPLPPDLEKLRLPLPPDRIHDAVAAADLVCAESPVLAREAAVLGTPAVLYPPARLGTVDDLSRRGLLRIAGTEEGAAGAAADFLDGDRSGLRAELDLRRERLIDESVDLTAWMVGRFGIRQALEEEEMVEEPQTAISG